MRGGAAPSSVANLMGRSGSAQLVRWLRAPTNVHAGRMVVSRTRLSQRGNRWTLYPVLERVDQAPTGGRSRGEAGTPVEPTRGG